jgi:riboflavin transporter FmnP
MEHVNFCGILWYIHLYINYFLQLPLYVDKVFLEIEDIIQLENEFDPNTAINKSQLLHDLLLV